MDTENHYQELESASATLVEGMHFAGASDDVRINLDAEASVGGGGTGPQPHRLLLLAMAGCTAMDVISILRKKRQQVNGLRVEVQGRRAEQQRTRGFLLHTRYSSIFHETHPYLSQTPVNHLIDQETMSYSTALLLPVPGRERRVEDARHFPSAVPGQGPHAQASISQELRYR